ncbi:MAG TPA: DsbA family protein [Thermomicrobiales bacterium]|jgi:protein-disulfide isomerase|nr:DsbA family protein [Thermomicrobiales bacterium]
MTEPQAAAKGKPGARADVARRRSARKIAAEREARRKRLFAIVGTAVLVLIIVGALVWAVRRETPGNVQVQAAAALPADIPHDDRVMGNPKAPVHVVEYGDFQCPACHQFFQQSQPTLIDQYVKPGKVSFEFRDYAFIGPESMTAAQAAMCANDQGKFWQFHDSLYLNQGAENSGAFSKVRLQGIAQKVGLDMTKFDQCLDSNAHQADVEASIKDAQAKGVDSTPTLFVNGQKTDWRGWDGLKADIDKALGA